MKNKIFESAWTAFRRVFYRCTRFTCRVIASTMFSFRSEGSHNLDFDGGAIVLSTHQSMMDPVLVGIVSNRRLCYLARKTLFHNPLFAFLIRLLDAIEIDRERGGLSGLKEMLRRLKQGEKVLMFPEGTRSPDGKVGTLKPGFIPIARRSEVPIVPVAVVGAFDCLPRGSKLPTRMPISVVVGEPLQPIEYCRLADDELMLELTRRILALNARGVEMANAHKT